MAGNIVYIGNGHYRLRVSTGSGKDRKVFSQNFSYKGKNIQEDGKTEEGKFPRAIETELAKYVTDVNNGQIASTDKISFKEFSERWLIEYAERQLEDKTVFRYKELLVRINDGIGHIKLHQLGPSQLNKLYSNLEEVGIRKPRKTVHIIDGKKVTVLKEDNRPLSKTTVNHHHKLISSILGKAVQWGCLISNPAERADPPMIDKKDAAYMEEAQTTAVIEALINEPVKYQAMIILDMFSGIRRGELVGLNWSDINFVNGVMDIEKAMQYIPHIGTDEKKTKTKASQRMINIPDFVLEMLKIHKREQDLWKKKKKLKKQLIEDNDKIFIQRNGKPMHPDTPSKWFPKFLKKNNLSHVNFHGLRHTNASIMMDMGFDVSTAASILGHAKKSTFLDIYAHMFRSKGIAVANAMQNKFGAQIQDTFSDTTFTKGHINKPN